MYFIGWCCAPLSLSSSSTATTKYSTNVIRYAYIRKKSTSYIIKSNVVVGYFLSFQFETNISLSDWKIATPITVDTEGEGEENTRRLTQHTIIHTPLLLGLVRKGTRNVYLRFFFRHLSAEIVTYTVYNRTYIITERKTVVAQLERSWFLENVHR